MNTFSILGGCGTRDMFNLNMVKETFKLKDYFGWGSIETLFYKSHIPPKEIDFKNMWCGKMVEKDFNKSFLKKKFEDNEYLILDILPGFSNEVIEFKDGSAISNSPGLQQSNYLNYCNMSYKYVEKSYEQWEHNATLFEDYLKKINFKNLILHERYYKEKYWNDFNQLQDFSSDIVDDCKYKNEELKKRYDFFKNKPYCVLIIGDHKNNYFASTKNRWGLSATHYEENYFINIFNQINNFLESFRDY